MATQLQCHQMLALSQASSSSFPQRLHSLSSSISTFKTYKKEGLLHTLSLEKSCAATRRKTSKLIVSSSTASPYLDSWKPDNSAKQPSLSDIIWPSAGAFAAMAVLGKMDQMLVQKGVSMSVAPLGAVCAILFTTPSAPAARLYNVFMAQICCAAIGVLAFSVLGPGWLARSTALAASIAFMICTRSLHPPAASLPLLFIDGGKFHRLNFCLINGETLSSGQFIENDPYRFIMQSYCNLVLYMNGSNVLWSSGTIGRGTSCRVTLQNNGNLVILSNNNVVWSSDSTLGSNTYRLIVQGDGNVVIYGQAL